MRHHKIAAGVCAALFGVPAVASAQAMLDEVVVEARKRSENVQEVPIAVSAISADALVQADIRSISDLSAVIPNFQAPRNTVSFGAPQFYMRGAGRANNNWNAENAVAVFVDDVYMQSTAGLAIDVVEFESVEALRGPQGTLYGRNATTGAIKFNPRKPSLSEHEFRANLTLGSNRRRDVTLTYSIPVIADRLGVKVDLYRTENDGFLDLVDQSNRTLDPDFGRSRHTGIRIASLWQASDDVTVEFNVDGVTQDDGTNLSTPIVPSNPADFTQLLSKRGNVEFTPFFGPRRAAAEPLVDGSGAELDSGGAVLKIAAETGIGTFKSITGFRKYKDWFNSQLSGRGTPSTLFGVTLYSTVISFNDFEQLTQEFQLTGKLGTKIDYAAGVYYFDNDWNQRQYGATIGVPVEFSPVQFPGAGRSFGGSWNTTSLQTTSYAAYVDATWYATDSLSVFVGGRYTDDEKKVNYDTRFEDNVLPYPGFPVATKKSWNDFSPRAGLKWQITPDAMAYLSFSRGYKAGSLEGDRATDPVPATTWLDPEVVKTYELGLKSDWFGSRLRSNLVLFKSKYTNKADLTSPQTAAVADVDIDGAELELQLAVTEGLRFWVNAGLLDAEYVRAAPTHPIFQADPTGFVLGLRADPVVTPKYSLTAGIDYTLALGNQGTLDLRLTGEAVDDHYNGLGVQNYDSEIVAAYEVFDASVTYRPQSEKWSVTLGGSNLTDEEYWTTGFFGSVPEYAGRYYADGRTWYLRFGYQL